MKYNFFKKRKAQVYVLITTMLLCVSACAFSSFDTQAESTQVTNWADVYDFSSIEYLEYADNDTDFQYAQSNAITLTQNLISENKLTIPGGFFSNEYLSNFPNYAIIFNSSNSRIYIMYADENAFLTVYRGQSGTISLNSSNFDGNFRYYISRYNSSGYIETLDDFTNSNPPSYYVYDDVSDLDYDRFYQCSLYGYQIVASTIPIYVHSKDDSNIYLDQVENVNPTVNGSGVNTEDIVNHLTLKDDTKFYISNSSFNSGNLYIYPVFDKTQLDENETLNQYYLRLTGTVSTNTTYNGGSTTYKAKVNGKRVTTYFPMSSGSSNIYNFSLGSSGGSYYDIPLSSVNNGKYEMSFSQLHKLFYGSGSNDNNFELLARGYDSLYGGTSYFESVSNFIGGISVKGFNYNPQTSADIDIVPTKVHYHLDLYVVKKSLDEESISDVQSYIDGDLCDGNGISGENVNTSSDEDIMNALGTDYVPNEYTSPETNTDYADTYNNVGGSSSSSSGGNSVSPSITGGNNNIVITNNNTNNGSGSGSTSESSLVGSTIVTTLIKYIAGNKSSSVSYIEDIAGTNTYLQIVSNYMSFIPTEIWSLVVTCFSVCIGVVVVAFIISIVIKIIT